MSTVTTSQRFTLNLNDLWKGVKIAVILPVLTIVYQSIQAGQFSFDWKQIGLTAVGGFIAYLIKNFFAPAEIVMTNPTKETVQAVKDGAAEVTVTKT